MFKRWIDFVYQKKDNRSFLLLGLLIVIGFFLRVYKLGDASYWIDESFTLMQVQGIIEHGLPLLDSGFIEKKDILLPYLLAPIAFFWGISNEFAMRIVVVFFGTANIFLAFLLGRRVFNNNIGLIFSFLITFSYWHIAWSRQVRGYELAVFFSLIVFLLLFSNKRKKSWRNKASLLLIFVVAVFAKSFVILLLPSLLLYLLLQRKYKLFAGFLVIGLAIVFYFKYLLIMALSVNHHNYFFGYFFGYFWNYFGIIFLLALVGFALSFKIKNKINSRNIILGSYFLVNLLFFSFFVYVFERRYLLLVTPVIFLYAAFFIDCFANFFKNKKAVFIYLFIFITIVFDFATVKSYSFTPKSFYSLEEYTPQPGFKEVYNQLNSIIDCNDLILTPYPAMSSLYLKKGKIASIAISYTGREDQSTQIGDKEYYTGIDSFSFKSKKEIRRTIKKLKKSNKTIYVVLDYLALNRVNLVFQEFVFAQGEQIFSEGSEGSKIYLFKL